MSSTRNNKPACSSTRFFFEKVNGKQFHPKKSGCDDFTLRIQIRKYPSVLWDYVAERLSSIDWVETFNDRYCCTKSKMKLVASFRVRDGDHRKCYFLSKKYQKAYKNAKKNGLKEISCDWPLKCRVRG